MTVNHTTRVIVLLGILFALAHVAHAQETTNTNCNVNGTMVNCTSTTTNTAAQQRQAYEAGQKVGNALGAGIAGMMNAHSLNKQLKKYCDSHPGEVWHYRRSGQILSSGVCSTNADKSLAAANSFMSKHKDFIPCPPNSEVLTAYLETHKLDPREEKSYERAYKESKKAGKLDLYAK